MCYQENEEYCLNRFPKKAKTEGMVYYFQKIDGVVVKTEITVEQWKELYLFNKRLYRNNLKHYDDRYFSRFAVYQDENGDEADPMEYQADTESFYAKALTQAESGEFAWSKGGLKKQVVALTAENADLKKRLDTSMGEVLELNKENRELSEHKVKTSIALTVLDRLQQEHYGTARLGT